MESEKINVEVDIELQDLVPGYIDNRKKEVAVMKEAVESADFDLVRTLGHRMKGNAGGYGLDQLGTYGAQLETAAKASDSEGMTKAIELIEDYLRRVEVHYIQI